MPRTPFPWQFRQGQSQETMNQETEKRTITISLGDKTKQVLDAVKANMTKRAVPGYPPIDGTGVARVALYQGLRAAAMRMKLELPQDWGNTLD